MNKVVRNFSANAFYKKLATTIVSALSAGLMMAGAATAGEMITVGADQVHIMKFDTPPATVIVGNPAFADVTIDMQKKLLIIQGRNFGMTNMILLDKQGNQMRDMNVQVTNVKEPNKVTVYRAGNRASYSCAPSCENTFDAGDSAEAMASAANAIKAKKTIATNGNAQNAAAPQ